MPITHGDDLHHEDEKSMKIKNASDYVRRTQALSFSSFGQNGSVGYYWTPCGRFDNPRYFRVHATRTCSYSS